LVKIICHGADREDARRRMLMALDEVTIVGISHTTAFLRDVIASDYFGRGELTTHFIDDNFRRWRGDVTNEKAALIAAALVASRQLGGTETSVSSANGKLDRGAESPWTRLGGFQLWERR
jgi:3-methylcrotonyl-CoA carboxylase alpha subunit